MIINTDLIYPIGAIYLSVSATNPATLFGGKWEQIKDRFLLAAGDTYSNGSTGGEANHKLTIAEMPSHKHQIKTNNDDWNNSANGGKYGTTHDGANSWYNTNWYTENSGGNGAHNNIQPYITAYFWKRIS